MTNLTDIKNSLIILKRDLKLTPPVQPAVENPKIQKSENGITSKIDRRHFNKRTPGSGRRPNDQTLIKLGIKHWVDQHVNEDVDVIITDKRTGKSVKIKKPRVMTVLEQLYRLGMGQIEAGNVGALREWLDRAVGKSVQPLEHRGDENKLPLLVMDI